jgi:hypothetical protein
MTKRHRKPIQFVQKPAVWQPMGNASFGDENEAQMKATDPSYIGVFKNDLYQVILREYVYDPSLDDKAMVSWLIIRRLDSEPIRDWRHMQRIKNDICGPEREGVEIYPAESRLVDTSNQYHLFVLPLGIQLPFGYRGRDVSDSASLEPGNRNKQRDFDAPPPDLNEKSTEKTAPIFGAEDRASNEVNSP